MGVQFSIMICENCGKEHDGFYGSGRFCSKECARSYSSKQNKNELKEAKCINCGKQIFINKKASILTCKCNECKNKVNKSTFRKIHSRHINTLIKYFGFDPNKNNDNDAENEFNRIRSLLHKLYWIEHYSSSEIANMFNYPNVGNLTGKVFKYLNISSKSNKESIHENLKYNKVKLRSNHKYKCGWHTTWNNNKVYLRSSYEFEYAKILDEQHIDYEVESLRIEYYDNNKKCYRIAIPDFYIPSTNTIVEIKSNYTLDIENMKDKKKSYDQLGYNFKLILNNKLYLLH